MLVGTRDGRELTGVRWSGGGEEGEGEGRRDGTKDVYRGGEAVEGANEERRGERGEEGRGEEAKDVGIMEEA